MGDTYILPQVHPHDWPGRERASTKPIHIRLEPGPGTQTVPLVGWTFAAGPLAAFVGDAWLDKHGKSLDEVHQQSLANLAEQPCPYRIMDLTKEGGEPVVLGVVEAGRGSNDRHVAAADHILNRKAMLALQGELQADPMVVTIPYTQVLYAAHTRLVENGMFLNLAANTPPPGGEALSAMVFVIQNGEIVGKVSYR